MEDAQNRQISCSCTGFGPYFPPQIHLSFSSSSSALFFSSLSNPSLPLLSFSSSTPVLKPVFFFIPFPSCSLASLFQTNVTNIPFMKPNLLSCFGCFVIYLFLVSVVFKDLSKLRVVTKGPWFQKCEKKLVFLLVAHLGHLQECFSEITITIMASNQL